MVETDYGSFFCPGNHDIEIVEPAELALAKVSYQEMYTQGEAMAKVAAVLREKRQDKLCKIPFCLTIEAEAFGAEVDIKESATPPALKAYNYKNWKDLAALTEMDFDHSRVREVLIAVRQLRSQGHEVAVRIEAPFTVLAMLMDFSHICVMAQKKPQVIEAALEKISAGTINYINAVREAGAKVISFADPSGNPGLVGEAFYHEFCGKYTKQVMLAVQPSMADGVIHLCGRSSAALYVTGMIDIEPWGSPAATYGESILAAAEAADVFYVGHGCMNNTGLALKSGVKKVMFK